MMEDYARLVGEIADRALILCIGVLLGVMAVHDSVLATIFGLLVLTKICFVILVVKGG
jgi:hypothetical protein